MIKAKKYKRPESMLTFESDSFQGASPIVEKLSVRTPCHQRVRLFTNGRLQLQSLPFQQVKHQVNTLDAQPSGPHGGILILVTGALLVCRKWPKL